MRLLAGLAGLLAVSLSLVGCAPTDEPPAAGVPIPTAPANVINLPHLDYWEPQILDTGTLCIVVVNSYGVAAVTRPVEGCWLKKN